MTAKEPMNFERLHVLAVDDNPNALNILSQVLSSFGVKRLTRVLSAHEAQAVLMAEQVDLVLTDATMPEVDGYDLVFWLRHEAPQFNRHIPILILTGHTPSSSVQRARDCGAHFVVTKPITPKVILERICWCAKSRRMMIESDGYVGPDRRFRTESRGTAPTRRGDDAVLAVADAG